MSAEVIVTPKNQPSLSLHLTGVGIQGPPGRPGATPRWQRWLLDAPCAQFVLPGLPNGGVVLLSLNGLLQHALSIDGATVAIDPPAEAGDDVLAIWFE